STNHRLSLFIFGYSFANLLTTTAADGSTALSPGFISKGVPPSGETKSTMFGSSRYFFAYFPRTLPLSSECISYSGRSLSAITTPQQTLQPPRSAVSPSSCDAF
ncbi:MAG: hypothetical protein KKC71_07455, partial [Chloroflexi bacterium]|nr:hypothetical protein [Chloroflexota bacterium]